MGCGEILGMVNSGGVLSLAGNKDIKGTGEMFWVWARKLIKLPLSRQKVAAAVTGTDTTTENSTSKSRPLLSSSVKSCVPLRITDSSAALHLNCWCGHHTWTEIRPIRRPIPFCSTILSPNDTRTKKIQAGKSFRGSGSGSMKDVLNEELRQKIQAGKSAYEAKKIKEQSATELNELQFLTIDADSLPEPKKTKIKNKQAQIMAKYQL
ncbi:hypothetical protein Tco_1561188 [Tanacetum coccineum]